jgi:uncharacterized protein YkwD
MNADLNGLINHVRMKMGREPVTPSSKLAKAARVHARDMFNNGPLGVNGSDGSNVLDRVRRTGYRPCLAAQLYWVDYKNTSGATTRTLKQVFNDWVNDDVGHAQLKDKRFMEFGVSEYNGVWSLVLAQPCRG